MKPKIVIAALAAVAATQGASGGAFAATIILRGAFNGETAVFADKLVDITNNALGNFDGTARAIVPLGAPAVRTVGATGKLVGAVGTTGVAAKTVGAVTASAIGNWAVTAGGAGSVLLTTGTSSATVTGAGPPRGLAAVQITDPMTLVNAHPTLAHPSLAHTDLELTFGLSGSPGSPPSACGSPSSCPSDFVLTGAGPGYSTITDVVGTNIPGYSTLFRWSISLNSQDDLSVMFSSDRRLGLNDAAIEGEIKSALDANFDPSTETYSLPTNFNYLTDLDVPVGKQKTVEMSFTETALAVNGVPESSTWAMMLLGFAGLGVVGYRSQRRASPSVA